MNTTLYQYGLIQFKVWPFNVNEVTHTTGTDWSRKEIAGAPIFREWVGEGDEEINLRGKVIPYLYRGRAEGTGLGSLDYLDMVRRYGKAYTLIRGDGINLGWYVIERLIRGHQHLNAYGIGRQIEFEASFQRVPAPDPATFYKDTTFFLQGQV